GGNGGQPRGRAPSNGGRGRWNRPTTDARARVGEVFRARPVAGASQRSVGSRSGFRSGTACGRRLRRARSGAWGVIVSGWRRGRSRRERFFAETGVRARGRWPIANIAIYGSTGG